ncbi:MAG: hypothetical protein ABH837_00455 [bacterium]
MSRAKRFTFIYGVVIVGFFVIALIAVYAYFWELPKLNLEPYNLKATSIVSKIRPDTNIVNFDNELALYSLRGQTALGQIVLRSNKDIEQVEIKIEGLQNESEDIEIDSDDIQIGLEGFIKTTYKSDPAADSIGYYPDPVIFDPEPFKLKQNKNQPLVIRIDTMRSIKSGIYKGTIDAYFDDILEKSIDIKLYIFDKRFPIKRELHTLVGVDKSSIRKYYTVEDEKSLLNNLVLDGLEHGFNIFGTDLERPLGINEVDKKDLDFEQSDQYISEWRQSGLNSIFIPGDDSFHIQTYGGEKFFAYLKHISDHYENKDWLEDSYIYPISDPETEDSYKRIKELYTKLKDQISNLSILLTEQVTPDKKDWPSLVDLIDIWIPHGEKYYEDYEAMQKARNLEDAIGFYTPGRYAGFEGYSDIPTPSHSIDRAFNDLVFAGLEAYKNSDTYHLMWNSTWWSEADPWEDPQTWKAGKQTDNTTLAGNGTGYLYYPASDVTTNMPEQKNSSQKFIPSLRLLAFEQGLNLYEVAKIAKLKKNIVPDFVKISTNTVNIEYQIFLTRLYDNFKINNQKADLPDYKSKWRFNLQSILPKW